MQEVTFKIMGNLWDTGVIYEGMPLHDELWFQMPDSKDRNGSTRRILPWELFVVKHIHFFWWFENKARPIFSQYGTYKIIQEYTDLCNGKELGTLCTEDPEISRAYAEDYLTHLFHGMLMDFHADVIAPLA
jgi:hypothetical protein